EYELATKTADAIARRLVGDPFPSDTGLQYGGVDDEPAAQPAPGEHWRVRPSFEVLVVADATAEDVDQLRDELRRLQRPEDAFTYELVFVPSFEDALVAVQLNFTLQACVMRPEFRLRSHVDLHRIYHFLPRLDKKGVEQLTLIDRILLLGEGIGERRPELDLYLAGHAT